MNISQVSGLSELNCSLFKQWNVKGDPSKRSTAKTLQERNNQRCIPGGTMECSWPGGEFTINPNLWVISIVRKKNQNTEEEIPALQKESKVIDKKSNCLVRSDRHVFLILQGIQKGLDDQYYTVIKEIHFFFDQDKRKSWLGTSGHGLIEIRDKTPRDLEKEMKFYLARSYSIVKSDSFEGSQVDQLLANVAKDQHSGVSYDLRGESAFFSAHSCLTWCESHLVKIGFQAEGTCWHDLLCAFPESHLPDRTPDRTVDTPCRPM